MFCSFCIAPVQVHLLHSIIARGHADGIGPAIIIGPQVRLLLIRLLLLHLQLLLLSRPGVFFRPSLVASYAAKQGAGRRTDCRTLAGISGNRTADGAQRRTARRIPHHAALPCFACSEVTAGRRRRGGRVDRLWSIVARRIKTGLRHRPVMACQGVLLRLFRRLAGRGVGKGASADSTLGVSIYSHEKEQEWDDQSPGDRKK